MNALVNIMKPATVPLSRQRANWPIVFGKVDRNDGRLSGCTRYVTITWLGPFWANASEAHPNNTPAANSNRLENDTLRS
jgi:hypothetical protein